ncbi:MAG: hypothetical protein QOF73_5, partial [Thermomicrobiales bacterium]|nr:hypothetical protein [Thermomicrobiales bacterium]
RILGEALLERGEAEPAIDHFDRALALDPLSVVARLGLGVAAEERKDPGLAYTHYLHAWEINPALDQVRGQLVRLRAELGSQDRLHPTRAGLAGIHTRTGQFGRAASEWRAILAMDPANVRARTSLAEVLWRAGDDAGAGAMCREVVRVSPDNARALAMLADIEKRQGAAGAGEWIQRYQAIDPMGEVAAMMGDLREGVDFSFLTPESPLLPDFDFAAAAAESPASAQAAAVSPALAASHVAAPDLWDTLVRDLQQDPENPTEADAETIQPFSWSDDGSVIDLGPSVEPFSLAGLQDLDEVGVVEPTVPVAVAVAPGSAQMAAHDEPTVDAAEAAAAFDLAAMFEAESTNAAPAPMAPSPVAEPVIAESTFADLIPAAPILAEPPIVESVAAPANVAPALNPFVTADGRVDLTIGWDEIDRALQAATPSEGSAGGYEDLLAELDAGGAAPFAADDGGSGLEAWEPFTPDEFEPVAPASDHIAAPVAPEPTPPLMDEVLEVAPAAMPWGLDDELAAVPDDWVAIDDDLIAAIPSPQPSGYTDLLRHVDIEKIPEPLEAEAIDVDPFANPDASGDPLGFEDLLTATSRDGTSELSPAEPDLAELTFRAEEALVGLTDLDDLGVPAFAWPEEPRVAGNEDEGLGSIVAALGEIEPFTFDDLDSGGAPGGASAGGVDFSDLEDVFAPVSFAGETPVEAVAEPVEIEQVWAPEPFAAEMSEVAEPEWIAPESSAPETEAPELDWAAAFAQVETPTMVADAPAEDVVDEETAVRWPTFIGHTSDLIDRETGGLFGRLRAGKQALVAAGTLVVDRSVLGQGTAGPAPFNQIGEISPPVAVRPRLAAVDGEPVPLRQEVAGEFDLTAMRVRLIESESAASEVAEMLEAAIAQGYTEPLALRVLGEAYLRLGRTEQAAAQFRQAMLARRRVR